MNGFGRMAFVQKKYAEAQRWYGDVVTRYGDSHFAVEAMYWRAVSQYRASHDHSVLGRVAEELRSIYPTSVWASKATPWLH
jgi:TolA-binding protein